MIRIERRLAQPRWLAVAVPLGSLVVAFGVMTLVLLATGHAPGAHVRAAARHRRSAARQRSTRRSSRRRRCSSPASAPRSRSACSSSTSAVRGSSTPARSSARQRGIALGNHTGWLSVPAMIVAGAAGGAALALVPAILRAFFSTNEIITSLMLNYVGALVVNYLIFDSRVVLARHVEPDGEGVPAGQEPAGRGELAGRAHRAGCTCRSGCCSASCSRPRSGCSTRARGSGSRCR